jgi:hypothetical protein
MEDIGFEATRSIGFDDVQDAAAVLHGASATRRASQLGVVVSRSILDSTALQITYGYAFRILRNDYV